MYDYNEITVAELEEIYQDTGWPHVADGDMRLAYGDAPEDV